METILDEKETEDPDYESISSEQKREQWSLSSRQQDVKDQTIQKIDNIIRQQFGFEIHLREREVNVIHERISQAKAMLDRLRACVLAKYYGTSELKGNRTDRPDSENFGARKSARNLISAARFPKTFSESATRGSGFSYKSSTSDASELKTPSATESPKNGNLVICESKVTKSHEAGSRIPLGQTCVNNSLSNGKQGRLKITSCDDLNMTRGLKEKLQVSIPSHTLVQNNESKLTGCKITQNDLKIDASEKSGPNPIGNFWNAESTSLTCLGSRFYLKKRIIIGNTSKFISIDNREENDKSTHKWMVYVRGPPGEPHIDRFIKKVWFFLHPSYRPNDIVEVNKPPFHLTRRGWGEFPVRVQLHFVDPRNKRVDVIHELKLDRTYTGLQTLGAETVVDLELDRRTFNDNCIPFDSSKSGIEETLSTNLVNVTANATEENHHCHSERRPSSTVRSKELAKKLVTENNSPSSFGISVQYPQLKKMKLESPKSVDVSSAISSVTSTPVNSLPASRCSSPETISSSRCELEATVKFTDEIRECLRLAGKHHPLIHSQRNLVTYPYCASSVEQFASWGIGKRRACEWQRAAAVRRYLSRCIPSCTLSTKDVLLWFRRYGYSPSDISSVNENASFCKLCGGYLHEVSLDETGVHECEKQSFTSVTSSTGFLSEIKEQEKRLPDVPKADDDYEDFDVDVVGLSPERESSKQKESKSVVYILSVTPEQAWVREACSDIGIKLKSISMDGVNLHVIETMLLAAVQRFAEDILRQSWACVTDQNTSYGIRLVTPSHVHKAVCSLPLCDFLSNVYLGEDLTPDDK